MVFRHWLVKWGFVERSGRVVEREQELETVLLDAAAVKEYFERHLLEVYGEPFKVLEVADKSPLHW